MKKIILSSLFIFIFLSMNPLRVWADCHVVFSTKAATTKAQKKASREIDAKKYKVMVEKFEGEIKQGWYLATSPSDPETQNRLNEISKDAGGSFSCEIPMPMKKPVIYLYPTRPTDVLVKLDLHGDFVFTHPRYDESIRGWSVTAYPDGRLLNHADGEEYSYLFWEGNSKIAYDLSTGFVIPGNQSRDFLRNILKKMGLTPREYNEFLVYWVPRMQDNPYNLIHFAGEEYTQAAPLEIIPKPDSILRIFMVFQALPKPISIPEQKIVPFERKGFSVVEWGGTELPNLATRQCRRRSSQLDGFANEDFL